MYLRHLTLQLLLVILTYLFAASSALGINIDSLDQAIEEMSTSPEKVRQLIKSSSYYQNQNPSLAILKAEMALAMAQEMDSTLLIGQTFLALGTGHFYKADYPKAIAAFEKSISILQEQGSREEIARLYINLGSVYLNMGNLAQAEETYLKAKEIINHQVDLKFSQFLNTNLAMVYTQQERYPEAMALHQETLTKFGSSSPQLRSSIRMNMGYINETQGQFKAALKEYLLAYQDAKIANTNYEKAYSLVNLSGILGELNRFQEANRYMDTLLPIAHVLGSPRLLGESYRIRAQLAEQQGNLDEAIGRFKEYMNLKDSMAVAQQNEEIAEIQSKLDKAGLEAEIKIVKKEIEVETRLQEAAQAAQNKTIWLLVGLLILVIIAVGVLIWLSISRGNTLRRLKEKTTLIRHQNQLLLHQKVTLEDLNREKDGLIGIVAHDLKSPLNKTMALVQMALSQGDLQPQQEKSLQMVLKTNTAANALIRDLLELHSAASSHSETPFELIDLHGFFHEAKESFAGVAQNKQLTLHWPVENLDLKLHSHPGSLSRVIENLVSNAVKFSPPGKSIYVTLHTTEMKNIQLSVRDEGPGISAKDRTKLFKQFQRLSARPTGGESSSGLGLAITKALVEKINGSIEFISDPGQGAEFVVMLPGSKP